MIPKEVVMQVSVIGMGAIGGMIAARLQKNDIHTEIVVKPSNCLYKKRTLTLQEKNKKSVVEFEHILTDISKLTGEVVFICTKSTANKLLFPQLSSLENKTFVIVQNGIGEEERLAEDLGDSNSIYGGATRIKVTKCDDNVTVHNDLNDFIYGPLDSKKAVNKKLSDILALIFTDVQLCPNLFQARFPKLVISAAMNGLNVLYNKDLYTLSLDNSFKDKVLLLEKEVLRIAQAYKVDIKPFMAEVILPKLSLPHYKGVNLSMQDDYLAGKKMELESIYGNLLQLASSKNIDVPELSSLYQKLNLLEGNETVYERGNV